MFARVLSRFDGFVADDTDPDNAITRINAFLQQMSAEQWDVCLQGLAEPGITELSPLQLMYGDCPVPGRKIMARDIKNLCSPRFLYYLHDDEYSVPESKRHADTEGVEVLYEDDHVLAVNKPAGLLTVPLRVCNKHSTSLMNRLIGQFSWTDVLPRAGLVHRIDLGTSGVCLVAKSLAVYSCCKLGGRLIKKYLAVARGNFYAVQGVIRIPLRAGFGSSRRLPACTVYEVKEKFRGFQLLECETDVARFHQIREHLKRKSHPVVGEYIDQPGKSRKRGNRASHDPVLKFIRTIKYPCLHASSIHFAHPVSQERLAIVAPMPETLTVLVSLLQKNRSLPSGRADAGVPKVVEGELSVLYEDQCILVLNKPSGLMTVPHALSNRHGDSVMERLVARDREAARMPKAGLLAHLDIGTSGVCLAAKNRDVYNALRFSRPVSKYLCIAEGNFRKMRGVINMPLRAGRNSNRVVRAKTRYQVKENFRGFQMLECQMETSCLHQIREHLKKRGHTVVGDYSAQPDNRKPWRGRRGMRSRLSNDPVLKHVQGLVHPCLHAQSICFSSPTVSEVALTIEAPEPQRFTELLALLRQHRSLVNQGSTSGDGVQDSTSGDGVQDSTSGDGVQDSTSGDGVQGSTSGDGVQDSTDGDGVQDSTAGDEVQDSTDGDGVQDSTNGDGVQDSTSADGAQDSTDADEATRRQDDEPESVAS